MMKKISILLLLVSLLLGSAQAQTAPVEKENGIGMVTGSVTGTYYRFGKDMSEAVAKDGINLIVKESTGSIDNIKRIDSNENAGFGIVQSDVLGFLSRSKEPKSHKIAENLRMVFPFYNEEVHIIANKNINSFNELQGKTVIVGPEGSGSWLTAMNLFSITGVQPGNASRFSPEEGLAEVLNGRADAMIFVAGKPVKLFENMEKLKNYQNFSTLLDNIHFLPMTDASVLKEYAPAKITPADYNFVKTEVPTVAVAAMLVTYDFHGADTAYGKMRCNEIKTLADSLRKNIGSLKQNGHPKWKEVNFDANFGIWKKDKCSTTSNSTGIENDLLNIIKSSH